MVKTLEEMDFKLSFTSQCIEFMKSIAAPLEVFKMTYFTHDRTYHDQSHFRLTTHGQWIESYYSEKLYKLAVFEKNTDCFCNGYILWSMLPWEPIYSKAHAHEISNGITLIEKSPEYCDFFHFGCPTNIKFSSEDIIKNIPFLKRYILFYKEKSMKIVSEAHRQRIILLGTPGTIEKIENIMTFPNSNFFSASNLTDFFQKTAVKRLDLGSDFDNAYLTRKEIDILQYLSAGEDLKKISSLLNIEYCTVRTHIKNIKEKFKCKNLVQLGIKSSNFMIR